MQKDSFEITDPLLLKEISHPVRKAILNCILNEALSAREISNLIDFQHEKIYYHIKKLRALELIVVAETEVINGITKKKYMAAAKLIKTGSPVEDLDQEETPPSDENEPEEEVLEPVEEILIEPYDMVVIRTEFNKWPIVKEWSKKRKFGQAEKYYLSAFRQKNRIAKN